MERTLAYHLIGDLFAHSPKHGDVTDSHFQHMPEAWDAPAGAINTIQACRRSVVSGGCASAISISERCENFRRMNGTNPDSPFISCGCEIVE